jgi:hypothetical protein
MPEASLLGRWFTGARREGFLSGLSPEAWHTLSAILSFTSRDGQRLFTPDQLALALGFPREEALRRLEDLAGIEWQGAPLVTPERDAAGEIAGATLAPLELLARLEPEEPAHADEREVPGRGSQESEAAAGSTEEIASPALGTELEDLGLTPDQIDWLTLHFPESQIRRQLDWLPDRAARNPAAMLIRAVEGDWAPPRRAK